MHNYGIGGVNGGSVEIGAEHVILKKSAGSAPWVVGILGKETDEKGRIINIVLDSLVHDKYAAKFGEYEASGVFVTELNLIRTDDEKKEDATDDDDDEY